MDSTHHIDLQIKHRRVEVHHVPVTELPDGLASTCTACFRKYSDITPEELRREEAHRLTLRENQEYYDPPASVPVRLPGCSHYVCLECALNHFHDLMENDLNEKGETVLSCPLCKAPVERKRKWTSLLKHGGLVIHK